MIEPVTPETPRPVHRVAMTQWWRDLAFLHWPVAPGAVAEFMPPGVRPDVLDGVTYVGLIAFLMDDVGLLRTPGVPYFGRFPETNVRTYSVDRNGRRGVLFLSMDAARLLPVLAGRAGVALPYIWSRMRIEKTSGTISYECHRRTPPGKAVASRIRVRVGEPIDEPSELEHFLTARWGLHTRLPRGRTLYLPNEHPRWPLRRAELVELDDGLVAASGLPAPAGPPVSVLYSAGVPARFGTPSAV
jgi:uncharacterized protein YqjF (DUF2071 family)